MPSSMFSGSYTLDSDLNRAVANASNNIKKLSSDVSALLSNLNGINDLTSPGNPYTISRENNQVYDMRTLYFETLSLFSSLERIVIKNKKEGVGGADHSNPPKKYYRTLKENRSIRADTTELLQKIYQYKTALKQLNTTDFERDDYTLQCFEKTKELMRLVDYLISPLVPLGQISNRLTNSNYIMNAFALLGGGGAAAVSVLVAGIPPFIGVVFTAMCTFASKKSAPTIVDKMTAGLSTRKIKKYIIHGNPNLVQDIQRFANGNRKKFDALRLLEDLSNANVTDIPNDIFRMMGNTNKHKGLVWLLNEILTKKRFDYLNKDKLLLDVNLLNDRNADAARVFRSLFGTHVQIDDLSDDQMDDLNRILRYLSDIQNHHVFVGILNLLSISQLSKIKIEIRSRISQPSMELLVGVLNQKKQALGLLGRLWHIRS